jgi:hypothetical protein
VVGQEAAVTIGQEKVVMSQENQKPETHADQDIFVRGVTTSVRRRAQRMQQAHRASEPNRRHGRESPHTISYGV